MARERKPLADEPEPVPVKIPRPVPGGTMELESLGDFVDNLFGHARNRRKVERELEPFFLRDDEMPEDPPPEEAPPPVPDGTEHVTEGQRPPVEGQSPESDDE